jgi:hypothetical protein
MGNFIERLVPGVARAGVGNMYVHTRGALGLAREHAARCFPPNPRLLITEDPLALH